MVGADRPSAEQVELAVPRAEVVQEADYMDGLLRAGKEEFQAVLLRVASSDRQAPSVLRAYRKVGPHRLTVLAVEMWDEPLARQLVAEGLADQYVLLPISRSELLAAVAPVRQFVPGPNETTMAVSPLAARREELAFHEGLDWSQKFARETAELLHTAHLGPGPLLERICWSGIFLFGAEAVKVVAEGREAAAGEAPSDFNFHSPLLEDGCDAGGLDMRLADPDKIDETQIGSWLRLLPGLIRLAGAQVQLRELANTDPVTGLANRRHMMAVLGDLIAKARDQRFRITLVIFDFDDFKHYNDRYGHPAGDEILREAAILIRKCIRRQDLAARFGGDEFALVLWDAQSPRSPGSEHPRSALAVMDRFCKMLHRHQFPKLGTQAQGALTISGGLATFPWDARSADELIEKADQALLEAKRSGKNRLYLVGQGPEPND